MSNRMTPNNVQEIQRFFRGLSSHVKSCNAKGLTDVSRRCENLFESILNVLYSWNLVNLNAEIFNHPAIDLGDKENKIGVQITTRSDFSRKNREAIMSFAKEYKEVGHLPEQYQHLIILYMTMEKIPSPKRVPKGFTVSVWSLQDLLNDMADRPGQQLEQLFVPIRQAIDDGLLYKPSPGISKDFDRERLITAGEDKALFSYGLGSVRIDAFLPQSYDDELCCALVFRDLQLSKEVKTLTEQEILGFHQHKDVVYFGEGKAMLTLKGGRFEVEAYVAEQLCNIFDALYDEYADALNRIESILDSKGFECAKKSSYKLISVPRNVWECMYHFANTHDALLGDTYWHRFCPQSGYGGNRIILLHNDSHPYRGDIICAIRCEYDHRGSICTLFWEPGYSPRLSDMEGYHNSTKWTVSFLHDWLLEQWIPYLYFLEHLKHRGVFRRLLRPELAFADFKKHFDPQRHGIYSYKG